MTSTHVDAQFARYGGAYKWLVTLSGMAGAFAMILSATMVNVAVPSIMGAYGVGQDMAQWAATAFLATMVASQLLNTWMVGTFGQRHAYSLTLLVFTVGAFVSATAPGIEMLIVGRIMQGFSAGVIQPLVMMTMISVFPATRRGFVIGLYGMGVTLAPSFGPLVGGITIDATTWRDIFLVPLPLVAFAFIMGLVFMPSGRRSIGVPSFDWTGFVLLCTALVCLMSGIGNGQRFGWNSDSILTLFAVGLSAAGLFIYSQLHARSPLLDLSLFRDRGFAAAMVIAFAFGAGNFATNYAVPVFTQTIQGFTATRAGLVLVPAGLLLVALIPLSGRMADNVPHHYPITAGCVLFAVATYLMASSDVNTPFYTMAFLMLLSRGGLGFVMPNMGAAAMQSVSMDRLSQGAGAYNFIRQMGGAFGVNTLVVVMEQRTAFHADALTATQTSANSMSAEFLEKVARLLAESGLPEAVQGPGALDFLGRVIHAQASTSGIQDAFLVISVVFIVALIPVWILSRARPRAGAS